MILSNNTTTRLLGTMQPGTAQQAGQRTTLPCYKGKRTLAWHFRVEADVTPTTADATAVVDVGSILQAFTECGVNDGADRLVSNPLDMNFMTQSFEAQPLQSKRLATLTAGVTTHCKEEFSILASPPYAANREEVSFSEHNIGGDFFVFVRQVAEPGTLGTAAGALIATPGGGGGSVVVSNVVIRVYQEFVSNGGKLPIFQPRWEQDTIAVTGTDLALPKTHLKNFYFQGMLFRQEVVGKKRVGDILTTLRQSQTGRVIIGDEQMNVDDLQSLLARSVAGSTYTINGVNPYVRFWYQRGGRLSKILKPNDPNFQTVMSVAQSATAGTSRIQITYFMLDRDQVVRSDGSRVTIPDNELKDTGLTI